MADLKTNNINDYAKKLFLNSGLRICPKIVLKIAILLIVFQTHCVFCQTSDLKHDIHEKVERYSFAETKGREWDASKSSLTKYTQSDLANALIAELDVDRGNPTHNFVRDNGVRTLYKALNLPPTLICKELEKNQSPQRKARLIAILYQQNTPEVITALLRQLKDRRPAVEFNGAMEEVPTYPLRVCDVACNILSNNLEPDRPGSRIGYTSPYSQRDEIIKETLKDLKLNNAQ